MTPKEHRALQTEVARRWTRASGLVVKLQGKTKTPLNAWLNIGIKGNTGLLVEKCTLWQGNTLLFEGSIRAPELKECLTALGACLAGYTTVRDIDKGKKPRLVCHGNVETCRFETCPLKVHSNRRTKPDAEQTTVCSP